MPANSEISEAIARLKKYRAEIDNEISILEAADKVLLSRRLNETGGGVTVQVSSLSASPGRRESPVQTPAQINRPLPRVVADAAAMVMAKGPVWRVLSQLATEIAEAGVAIPGNPVNNLSTILSRHKSLLGFVSDRQRGWALSSRLAETDVLASGATLGHAAQKE